MLLCVWKLVSWGFLLTSTSFAVFGHPSFAFLSSPEGFMEKQQVGFWDRHYVEDWDEDVRVRDYIDEGDSCEDLLSAQEWYVRSLQIEPSVEAWAKLCLVLSGTKVIKFDDQLFNASECCREAIYCAQRPRQSDGKQLASRDWLALGRCWGKFPRLVTRLDARHCAKRCLSKLQRTYVNGALYRVESRAWNLLGATIRSDAVRVPFDGEQVTVSQCYRCPPVGSGLET